MAEIKITKLGVNGAYKKSKFARSRFEKAEIAYGTVEATEYAVGDVLSFVQIPMLDLIKAEFFSNGEELNLWNSTNLETPINWSINSATAKNINYVIHYIRGTGNTDDAENSSGEGKMIKLQISA